MSCNSAIHYTHVYAYSHPHQNAPYCYIYIRTNGIYTLCSSSSSSALSAETTERFFYDRNSGCNFFLPPSPTELLFAFYGRRCFTFRYSSGVVSLEALVYRYIVEILFSISELSRRVTELCVFRKFEFIMH